MIMAAHQFPASLKPAWQRAVEAGSADHAAGALPRYAWSAFETRLHDRNDASIHKDDVRILQRIPTGKESWPLISHIFDQLHDKYRQTRDASRKQDIFGLIYLLFDRKYGDMFAARFRSAAGERKADNELPGLQDKMMQAVQEAVESSGYARERGSFEGFMYKICARRYIDFLRETKVSIRLHKGKEGELLPLTPEQMAKRNLACPEELDGPDFKEPSRPDATLAVVDQVALRQAAIAVQDKLTAAQNRVLATCLTFLEEGRELKKRDIAQALHVSEAAVGQHLSAIGKRCPDILEHLGYETGAAISPRMC
jgi:DNA-directed RNA polymerase specialized sigma24 family protein